LNCIKSTSGQVRAYTTLTTLAASVLIRNEMITQVAVAAA